MLRKTPALAIMFALVVGVSSLACGGGTQTDTPQERAVITSPTGLNVTSAISSVSLGESSANVQLAFRAGAAADGANVEVVSVTLVDGATGNLVDTLKASAPQVWNGNGYVPWNQRVTPDGDLKASYQLTAPSWSTIDGSGTGSRSSSYSRSYKLRVNLRIDGVDVLMQSTDLHREPVFQT